MSEFGTLIPRSSLDPINAGLHTVSEATMLSLLGAPKGQLTKACQDGLASDTVQRLLETRKFGSFTVTGIAPAIDSLQTIFDAVQTKNPALFAAVGTVGMLCVRLKNPTSGAASTEASNHAWGTAIDITIDGVTDLQPDGMVQRGIAELIPFFNDEGWFSGVGFQSSEDDSHFEVADETIQAWAAEGLFDPPTAQPPAPAPIGTGSPARAAFDFFVASGWSKAQAAGLIGNIDLESGFDPKATNPSSGAFGLCQWLGDRKTAFVARFGHSIEQSTFDEQLQFVNFELRQGNETKAGEALAGAQTAHDAGVIVCAKYERPGDAAAIAAIAPGRGDRADDFFRQLA
jgi:hypothetical protein